MPLGCITKKTTLIEYGGNQLTDAEQNRLIIDNAWMVAPLAAEFRGRKGVPFEDLVAEGMVGLVKAARMWKPRAQFRTYATHKIKSAIIELIDRWEEMIGLQEAGEHPDEIFYEWDIWSYTAPYECWDKLPTSPEEILIAFEEIMSVHDAVSDSRRAFSAAMLSLSRRQKKIIWARFMRKPQQDLASIAREHRISYQRTQQIIFDSLKKVREVVESIKAKETLAA